MAATFKSRLEAWCKTQERCHIFYSVAEDGFYTYVSSCRVWVDDRLLGDFEGNASALTPNSRLIRSQEAAAEQAVKALHIEQ